ncbi:MAG: tetratricopeptide repeat protein [Deltaproteobacteria bacterium]|nr:tetratricopeptide repeat protein [Deltaproteobacteria bacterium]
MGQSKSILAFGVGLALSGCVTTSQGNLIRADIKKVQDAVKELEKGTHDQKLKFEALVAAANTHIGKLQKLIKESTDFLAKNNAAFGAEMDTVKQTIGKMTGRIEEISFGFEQWKKDYGEFKAALEKKVGNIAQGLPTEVPDTPEGLLAEAAKRFKASEYVTARKLWEIFLSKHDKHEKAALTQYWIGQSFFEEGNYKRAVEEFDKVRKQWPQSDVLPATLFNMTLAFHALGEKDLAVAAANELIKAYPENELAKKAKKRLKEFKKGIKKATWRRSLSYRHF